MYRTQHLVVALCLTVIAVVLLWPRRSAAQDGLNPASLNATAPLPVYVTNTPALPEGFTPGSRWRFTTWTSPSVITWVGAVGRVSGPWAYITVTHDNATTARWYYVPAMPGSWDRQ